MQPHRLRALILEDLERFPRSSLADVHRRVGPEIPKRTIQRLMQALIDQGVVVPISSRRWRLYELGPIRQEDDRGA